MPGTMSETLDEQEKIKKKLAAKLKQMMAEGIEGSDHSGIHTPKSGETSDDSTKQLDPRNKHFSFEYLRIKQEKMKKYESGELEEVNKDHLFKNMEFKQVKDFEEVAESNIDKYKKLKLLEQK